MSRVILSGTNTYNSQNTAKMKFVKLVDGAQLPYSHEQSKILDLILSRSREEGFDPKDLWTRLNERVFSPSEQDVPLVGVLYWLV